MALEWCGAAAAAAKLRNESCTQYCAKHSSVPLRMLEVEILLLHTELNNVECTIVYL